MSGSRLLSPEEAWQRIADEAEPLAGEWLGRRESLGCVLATALAATVDVPPHDVAALDGYALAGDAQPGSEFEVAGVVAAGDAPGVTLPAACALRIMTGAPLPAGADRVVGLEATDRGQQRVRLEQPVAAGHAVRRRGEIVRQGRELAAAGTPVTAGLLAVLATHGFERLFVHRPPRLAVLATGNEVVPPEATPAPGQLRDSHTDFLLAAARGLGLAATSLGICRDDPEDLAARVARGLDHDVLLVCGGVSAGEFDFGEQAFARAGCSILFDGVAVQPGKPLVFARHRGGLVFGLPGNPASVMVGYWLFVRPALRRLLGFADGFWQGALTARLTATLPGAKARDLFLPATLGYRGSELVATPIAIRGSHDLVAYGRGNALARVAAHAPPSEAGTTCEVLPLADGASPWSLAI